jgi:type VI secretion system protein VasG
VTVSLRALVGKVNQTTRTVLEDAAGLALSRTHYNVEIEHFLLKLMDSERSDFSLITKRFGVDRTRLTTELSHSIDRLKTGSTRPSFS